MSNSKLPGRGTTKGLHASTLSSQAGLGFPSAALAFREEAGAAESLPGHLGREQWVSHLGLGRWGRGEKPLDIWKGEGSLAGRKGGAQAGEGRQRAGGRGAWEGAARSLLFYENPVPGLGPEWLRCWPFSGYGEEPGGMR